MIIPDKDALDRLVQALAECAGQIDQTFSVAGAQLGRGLTVFESLKDSLGSLSNELGGTELRGACEALEGLASDLETSRDKLPAETAALAAIGAESRAAAASFERLMSSMRLIGILARSARIEAATVGERGQNFGEFADEITGLVTLSQSTVEGCVREQEELSTLLASALASQRTFTTRYGTTLSRLAGELRQTLATVDARQRKSMVITREAAVHSGKIAVAAGTAIMALQSGDAIRQRLEHSLFALRLATGHDENPNLLLSTSGREALAMLLFHLQERQLDATAGALRQGVRDIEGALIVLAEETAPIMGIGRSLYGSDESAAGSFLQALETDLAQAAEILGKCQVAREDVDRVTRALTRSLDTLHETVSALETTVSTILLIGTNASLRAARLGQGGRSLIVIAQEMKAAAGDIGMSAAKIKTIFAAMHDAASALGGGRHDPCRSDALEVVMERSLAAIGTSADRLGDMLADLSAASMDFFAVIEHARLMFSNAAATEDAIRGGAALLARARREIPAFEPVDADAVKDILESSIRRSYTMVAEREIHDAVLEELSLWPMLKNDVDCGSSSQCEQDDFLF